MYHGFTRLIDALFSTQLDDSVAHSKRTAKDDVYLPAITTKVSSLSSMKGALSQSCPYLYDKRRGSFSSVASQRSGAHPKKQVLSYLQRIPVNALALLSNMKYLALPVVLSLSLHARVP